MIELNIYPRMSWNYDQGKQTLNYVAQVFNGREIRMALSYDTVYECYTALRECGFLERDYTACVMIDGVVHHPTDDTTWMMVLLSS
jgi:saccharopine dehydrogenase-like NADP-dependent oxidoreductase